MVMMNAIFEYTKIEFLIPIHGGCRAGGIATGGACPQEADDDKHRKRPPAGGLFQGVFLPPRCVIDRQTGLNGGAGLADKGQVMGCFRSV